MATKQKTFLDTVGKKVLDYLGTIGTVLSLVAYIIVIYIMTLPAGEYTRDPMSILWFAILNACMGIVIAVFLAIQGCTMSVNKNKELYTAYHKKETKQQKKEPSERGEWTKFIITTVLTRGASFAFTTFASWQILTMAGQDPALIGLAFANMGFFLSGGMLAMNKVYNMYENKLVPKWEKHLTKEEMLGISQTKEEMTCLFQESKTIGQEGCLSNDMQSMSVEHKGEIKDDSLREQQNIQEPTGTSR